MQICSLDIKGFGKFKGKKIKFEPGLNLVFGCNESGKSSLQSFIKAMIFGIRGGRNTKDSSVNLLKKYKPWTCTSYQGSLEYMLDDGSIFLIERDFEKNLVSVLDENYNDLSETFEKSRDKGILIAERHLGIHESSFDKTVFIRQTGIKIEGSAGDLLERMTNLHQTGNEQISLGKAQEALKDALKKFVGTDKTTTKPIDKIMNRLSNLADIQKDFIHKKNEAMGLEGEIIQKTKKLAKLRQIKAFGEKKQRVLDLESEISKKNQSKTELQDVATIIVGNEAERVLTFQKQEELQMLLQSFWGFSAFGSDDYRNITHEFQEFKVLENQAKELEKQKTSKEKAKEDIRCWQYYKAFEQLGRDTIIDSKLQDLKENENLFKTLTGVSGFLTALMLIVAFFLLMLRSDVFRISVICAILFFSVTGIVMLIKWRFSQSLGRILFQKVGEYGIDSIDMYQEQSEVYRRKQMQFQMSDEEIIDIEGRQQQVMQSLYLVRTSIMEKLYSAGVIELGRTEDMGICIERFKSGFNTYTSILPNLSFCKQRMDDLDNHRAQLLIAAKNAAGVNVSDNDDIIQTIAHFESLVNELTEELNSIQQELPHKWEVAGQLDIEKRHVEASIEALALSIREDETLLKGFYNEDIDLQSVTEEIMEMENKKNELEDIAISLKTAQDVLNRCAMEMKRDFAPSLNKDMSRYIQRITGGRYQNVRADDKLELKALCPETGMVESVLSLSIGTLDQMYLAFRIAASDLVSSKGEKLPLFLDEIFAHYDDVRTEETLKFLVDLSEDRQIILLTCKKREVELLRNVCKKEFNLINLTLCEEIAYSHSELPIGIDE